MAGKNSQFNFLQLFVVCNLCGLIVAAGFQMDYNAQPSRLFSFVMLSVLVASFSGILLVSFGSLAVISILITKDQSDPKSESDPKGDLKKSYGLVKVGLVWMLPLILLICVAAFRVWIEEF